jgi:hypothetical protein
MVHLAAAAQPVQDNSRQQRSQLIRLTTFA